MSDDKEWTCRGFPVYQVEVARLNTSPTPGCYVDTGLEARGHKIFAEEGFDETPLYKTAQGKKAHAALFDALQDKRVASALHHACNQSVTAAFTSNASDLAELVRSMPEAVLDGHLALLKMKGVETANIKAQWAMLAEVA